MVKLFTTSRSFRNAVDNVTAILYLSIVFKMQQIMQSIQDVVY